MQARTAFKILSTMGPAWVLRRLLAAAELRLGSLEKRSPAFAWEQRPLSFYLRSVVPADPAGYANWRRQNAPQFFFLPQQLPSPPDARAAIEQGNACLAGTFPWFSRPVRLGFPPPWHRDPIQGIEWPNDVHWSKIDEFAPGDVKLVWEASRFSFVFSLVRAYAASRDERFAQAFWTLVEDWARSNPPNMGVQWRCGQEASFRAMAWCFGLWAFLDAEATTPQRVATLAVYLAVHADRIAVRLDQAVAQRNNHGLSEAVGMFTIASLFPEFRESAARKHHARLLIGRQVSDQFYDDGSYIQHSFNYERLALHDLFWAMRLAEVHGEPFSGRCYRKVGDAGRFLAQFCDPESGELPNYGHNDGALLLPLAGTAYGDFRPTIQAASLLSEGRRWLEPAGPWDEFSAWLGLSGRAQVPTAESHHEIAASGYLKMECRESWAMLRAATYKDRPAQADQLHFDLWWRGLNIACDPGTYSYNSAGPWDNALGATAVHNTVTLYERDQMTRASRFLWLDWAQAHGERRVLRSQRLGEIPTVTARHDGYRQQGVLHRRTVLAIPAWETWLVVDDLLGRPGELAELHWLLEKFQFDSGPEGDVDLRTERGPFYIRTRSSQAKTSFEVIDPVAPDAFFKTTHALVQGWVSRNYMEKTPAISLKMVAITPARFVSVLSANPVILTRNQQFQIFLQDTELKLQLSPHSRSLEIESSKRRETLEWS